MSEAIVFQPLSDEALNECIDVIEPGIQLVAVTLTDGDMLMGGLLPPWFPLDEGLGLHYNTEKGQTHGSSYIVQIPHNLIADIRIVPLSESSVPHPQSDAYITTLLKQAGAESLLPSNFKVAVKNYPNPFASIICQHNEHIAQKHHIEILDYMEKALSEAAVPPEGIRFDDSILLYADWDYFSQNVSGGVEVSAGIPAVMDVTKALSPSLHERATEKLKGTLAQRATSPKMMKEHRMRGCILVDQKPQDTEIQGEKCIVVTCASTDKRSPGETFPVLLKLKHLNYPQEFLRYIISELTFYGELLPIPIEVVGKVHHKALLARAIGYIP